MVALSWSMPRPALAALDFQCVEPSRYKNLLQVFNDDPATFFSYFNLSRRPLPQPELCRAILVTGTIDGGAAEALLARIAESRGWLAALYLSFTGTDHEQEAAMATIVRQFSLKTYEVRGPVFPYAPDFVVRWTPAVAKGGFMSPPPSDDPSPLDAGLAAFLNRSDRLLKLSPKRFACSSGCRAVWMAGASRLANARLGTPEAADEAADRLRSILAYRLDRGRLPAADDPILKRPFDAVPTTPPVMAIALRKECDAEITVAEGLEARVAEAVNQAIGRKLASSAVAAIAPHLNALKRAGVRLQRCLAAAHENHRLRAFQAHCPKDCNRGDLLRQFTGSASGFLKEARAL
ncbi:MAG: hypothetical protein IT536_16410 [Hyphomicrobiales bacterium]|nr:hypothetical protein [Hyphomicrobiales bacterium]